ncbi:MAG: tRNA lysidine(34) synthetase TilS [Phycisphaerales bacterium]
MSDGMEKKVADYLRLYRIFAGAGGALVAVSGGADSICLLHLLKTLQDEGLFQARLVCAHINHRLRGQASNADEQFVIERAGALGLSVVTRAVDVPAHAEMHRLSIETAGRQLRLDALAEIAHGQGCSWVATGHHKDDNAETVIHRLRRGTGFRGLAGIRPIRPLGDDQWLARPLLCVTRDEIVRYLREHALRWREDHTNTDTAYMRNYIRHKLLPLLQQESQTCLVEGLSDLASSAGRLYDRIRQEVEKTRAAITRRGDDVVRIDATELALLPELVAIELIRQTLVSLGSGERNLTEHHYRNTLRLARRRATNGAVSLPGGFYARYESGQVVLIRGTRRPLHIQDAARGISGHCTPSIVAIPGRTQFCGYEIDTKILDREESDMHAIASDKGPFAEYMDWDRVKPPVVVRPRLPGDRFEPLGLGAAKKVGKFLTTAKVPRDLRERTIIVADQEKILWVCPIRIAEPVRITDKTQRVLKLTVAGRDA